MISSIHKEEEFKDKICEFINSAFEKLDGELNSKNDEWIEASLDSKSENVKEEHINSKISSQRVEFCLAPDEIDNSNLELKNDNSVHNLDKNLFSKIINLRENFINYLKRVFILNIFFLISLIQFLF